MYKALPKNEKTFTINMTGETTGELFEGQFTTKCVLNISDVQSKELEKTRLLADYANPTPKLAGIAEIRSTLAVKLIKWPDWWANLGFGTTMMDDNVFVAIYDKVQAMEDEWRSEVRAKAQEKAEESPMGNGL